MAVMRLALLLTVTWTWSQAGSQDSAPVSLPIVPRILGAGQTIPEPCPRVQSRYPRRYMIAWNDTPGIDGDFILVVHPTQLFLRSAHNNPNPDFIYWVGQLSASQYGKLVTFLDAYSGRLFTRSPSTWPGYSDYRLRNPRISPWHPDRELSSREQADWLAKSLAAANFNLRRILRELNRGLSSADARLPENASINSAEIVRIED